MRLYATKEHRNRPRHAAGEIVWATFGNYIENPNATRKLRPVVILRAGECQHWAAGLTTQATFKTSGDSRVALPGQLACGLGRPSYLWSQRPSRVCRLDVRWHAGWINAATVAVIEEYMHMPWHVLAELRTAVREMTNTAGTVPAGYPL